MKLSFFGGTKILKLTLRALLMLEIPVSLLHIVHNTLKSTLKTENQKTCHGANVRSLTSVLWKLSYLFNPIDTGIFFDACVPGVCEKSHPPQNQFCFYKTTFFLHEVKFCINSALFLCTVLFSSSILMNFSDFG